MTNKSNQVNIYDILGKDNIASIEKMINGFKKGSGVELEVSYRNIDYPTYMRVIQHYIDVTTEDGITSQNSLDISVSLPEKNTYRVSIVDEEEIDAFTKRYSGSKNRNPC